MQGFCLWFTGLSGAGKSTLAENVKKTLNKYTDFKVEILDGDEIRTNLSKGLGFSKEDRDINVKRIGYVAKLLARNGVIVIVASISPYEEVRNYLKKDIPNFIEIYCKCPLETLYERDPKGLYKKVLKGKIKNFTGIDDPYEAPKNPNLVIETDKVSVDEGVIKILEYCELFFKKTSYFIN